ncbi:MAG: glycoside hydrolase family 2 sugar binding protein [Homoserinimonas sp.]|nr:glycoside hydrolase family 2 sugar binding protein [Homoserinimonas sp.]
MNGSWRFTFDEGGTARRPEQIAAWDATIEVPYAPESERSGIGDRGFHSHAWYQRDFEATLEPGERLLLHFGAVDYEAEVWVNNFFVGHHEGGHTPFAFDVTDAVANSSSHVITVHAQDDPHDLAKPRGKQDWQLEPHSIWYPRTTGIWQTVWAEVIPATHVEHVRWTPHLDRWEIGFEAVIAGRDSLNLQLHVRLTLGERVLIDDSYEVIENAVLRRLSASDPGIDDYRNELLWSPEKPTLIDAELTLTSEGNIIDNVRSYTAMRGLELERGRLLLNHRPYYLRMVLDQGYWPESLMTPPSQEAIIRDIQLVKAAGFNGVRKHQKIEDPRFLYWADRLGLLVWEEMPSPYRFTHQSIERVTREWMEVIDRDSNHPCIIVWVPFNESWGVPNLRSNEAHRNAVQALFHLTRTLDPSRPVIGNDGWESSATDIVGIHDYDDDPRRIEARYRSDDNTSSSIPDLLVNGFPGGRVLTLEGHPHMGQPIMLTEFGGIAHRDRRDEADADIWGYSVSLTVEDLQHQYFGLLNAINNVGVFSGFCYTQFTDTFQEANGLFFFDRTPKFDLAAMAAATRGTAAPPGEVAVPDARH